MRILSLCVFNSFETLCCAAPLPQDELKQQAALKAVEYVKSGMKLGTHSRSGPGPASASASLPSPARVTRHFSHGLQAWAPDPPPRWRWRASGS